MEKLDKKIIDNLYDFIEKYGYDGLKSALQSYSYAHQMYLFRSHSVIKQIPIYTINYIEILKHEITIHTTNGKFSKYGTLKNEYNQLKKYGFVKCSQSFLIPVSKIAEIGGKHVTLTTGDKFILSRTCATEVICAYTKRDSFILY